MDLFSQESEKYQKLKGEYNYFEGFVVLKDSTIIEGLIRNDLDHQGVLFSMVYFVNKEGKKVKYVPDQLISYEFPKGTFISNNDKFYQLIRAGNGLGLYPKCLFQLYT